MFVYLFVFVFLFVFVSVFVFYSSICIYICICICIFMLFAAGGESFVKGSGQCKLSLGPESSLDSQPNRIPTFSNKMRQKSLKFFRPWMPLFQLELEQKCQFDFQFFEGMPLIVSLF